MILKFERFSHLSDQCFGLSSPIELEVLSFISLVAFIESRYIAGEGYLGNGYLEEGYPVPQRWVWIEC